jgi:branched-chain amino acid aminotransferase
MMITSNNNYCCFDGQIITTGSLKLTPANRAFRYGDSVFETIRCFGNQPYSFADHYDRLKRVMMAVGMDVDCLPAQDVLERKVESVINRNRYFISSRVRIMVFRHDGGLYTPATDKCSYLIEASPMDTGMFEMNEKGLIAGVYREMGKSPNILSPFKTGSALLYVMAGRYKQQHNLTECFIVNTSGLVIEALSSNLFWFKGDQLLTTSVSSGCVDGIMRRQILLLAKKLGIDTQIVPGVTEEALRQADEIFVTNAIQGIQWVVGIDDLRFFNIKTRKLLRAYLDSLS